MSANHMTTSKTNQLSRANWQQVAEDAVKELAPRVANLVFTTQRNECGFIILVSERGSVEEDFVGRVELRFWNALKERGWPEEHNEIYGPGGHFAFQINWPSISIHSVNRCIEGGVFPERSTKRHLKHAIKEAILEEAFAAGLVSRRGNERGPFINEAGKRII